MKHLLILTFLFGHFFLQAQMPNTLSNTDKIYGLSKFWQEVNYNFVYLNQVDRQAWDSIYQVLLEDVQKTKDDYEYYRLLQKFSALLKDGHTNVFFPKEVSQNIFNTNFGEYRFFITNIDGKAIITRVNLSKKEEIPIGTEVIEVNGLTTADYIREQVMPYISSSTDYVLMDWAMGNLLAGPINSTFEVKLKLADGSIRALSLKHTITSEKEVYPPFEDLQLFDFKWLEEELAYLALNSFDNPAIDSLFVDKLPELYKAKKLIIDLRNNGGGSTNIGRDILQYLTNDTLLYGSRNFSRLHIPSFKAWGKWTEAKDTIGNPWARQEFLSFRDVFFHEFPYEPDTVRLNAKRLVVPTAILIGHQTASAAEDFLIYTDKQKHMVKIGTPSFGSTGQPMFFDLPGGGSARICTKKDTYPDGKLFVGVGVQPDIWVEKTLEDHLQGNDPVLEAAVEYLKKK